ncbi:class I SAM-dependent methyltransferase [Capillimicrobium parvum]|uniref:2-methoxy-6-polyprenyl-1,4-benzoquinol methylase, mitochondrial n=1 Tax=Capillimicrobium parvum TaxID=2884022 RepID=A0A9E6XWR7_9ACTN|nr:class I SAM-dependent methyltransferase [Capillimicrobium parvum]UGS35560.1 2-methoxy-6-polyprenyl-1,4-benzoquinol methylase, mitochondrial [Capillimicrobium parvum]
MTGARPDRDDLSVLLELAAPAGRDVLDVGCGLGTLTRELAAAGARAIGMEISPERAEAAAAQDAAGVATYVAGRAEALPLGDATMDAVVFMRSLHHVPGELMDAALAEARRVLRPGGVVYLAEPLTEGALFALIRRVDDETKVRELAQAAIARADGAGFERAATVEYDRRMRLADVAAVRRLVVGVDPARAAAFDASVDEIARDFEALGEPDGDGGGRWFGQPMRADLLLVRPAAR